MAETGCGPSGRTGNGSTDPRGPTGSPGALIRALIVLSASLVLAASLIGGTGAGTEGNLTRAVVDYSATLDGEGTEGDICLAGFREYTANITLFDVDLSDVELFEMDIEEVSTISGNTIHQLLRYSPSNSTLVQLSLAERVGVTDLDMFQTDRNVSVKVMLFFHLDWDLETSLKLLPRLKVNGSTVQLDTNQQISFNVWGDLDVTNPLITYENGSAIEDRSTLRSGTLLTLSGIRFNYIHPTESFSVFSPLPEEVRVTVNDSISEHGAEYTSGSFRADLILPRAQTSKITLTLRVEGARSDWLFRVKAWRFEIYLDDIAPTITLKRPGKDIRVDTEEFQFEVQFQDQPSSSPILLNGSSLAFRVKRGPLWSDWTPIPAMEDARTISYVGNAVGQRGVGNTSLQFRAKDRLGNSNDSSIFQVHINAPPIVTVPDDYEESIWLSNTSLSLDGRRFAYDPDNDELGFEWYIEDVDINPLSSNRMFNRSLFNIDEGRHTVRLVVSDGSSEKEVSFNFTVKKVKGPEDDRTFVEILIEEGGMYFLIPLALLVAIAIVVPVIIVVHKRTREDTDFVVDESNVLSSTQADDMARKLRELYEGSTVDKFSENDAEVDLSTEFDFDYNLYEILGIEKGAPPQDIKRKYRDLAAFYHPDRVAQHKEITLISAVEQMIKINKAKEILLNPEIRAKYDSSISDIDFAIDMNEMEESSEDWG